MLQGRSCEYQAKTMCNSFLLLMSHFPFRQIISPKYDSEGLQSDLLDKLDILLDRCHCFRKKHKAFFSRAFSQSKLEKEHTIPSVPDYLMWNFRGFPYRTKKRRRHWGSKGKLSLQRRKSKMNLINGKRYWQDIYYRNWKLTRLCSLPIFPDFYKSYSSEAGESEKMKLCHQRSKVLPLKKLGCVCFP